MACHEVHDQKQAVSNVVNPGPATVMPPEHPPEPVSGAGASLLLESQKGRGHGGRGTGSST